MTDQPATTSSRPSKRRFGDLLLGLVWWGGVAMAVIGFVAMFGESVFADPAIPILIRQAALLLAAVCAIVWFVFGSRAIKGVVAQLIILVVVAALPFIFIKGIEFTGDMNMIVHWRGSKTQEERLKEFNATAPAATDTGGAADDKPVIGPFDMPSFNGPGYDGRVPGPTLITSWESDAPIKLWERPVGAGYAGVAIVDDRIVTLEQRDTEELITCYDLKTGNELWHHSYTAEFYEAAGGRGPRSTPLITGDGRVYTTGALGDVCCLDLADGKLNWQVELIDKKVLSELHEQGKQDQLVVMWGIASSPLAWRDLIIVNKGGPEGKGLIALNRENGEYVWTGEGVVEDRSVSSPNRAGYSTPTLATIDGVELIVHLDGEGLRGYIPDTGEIVWSYAFENLPGVNVAQPIVIPDGRVFITCGYGVGCRMLQVKHEPHEEEAWQVSVVWESQRMSCKFCSPILIDGYIYGLDQGVLACISAETGERQWKGGRYGHGQMLLRGEHLVVFTEAGEIALVRPNPEELEELALLPVFDREKNWNPPGLAGDILVVRNHYDMAAFELPVK